ncbi:MAG: HAMP domain-containing histidine kinase, partial [Calditrichia bacterium]|nr:HAMP domain-containing histidine kinase [Calditrichia bacterium]
MKRTLTYEDLLAYVDKLEKRVKELEAEVDNNDTKAEELKTKFLSNISHELRTPMNAILGFSSLLNDQQLPHNKREEYVNHINQSSAKLLNVVEAMIDVSMIQTGQLKIRQEECFVNQFLTDIYHYFNVDRHRNDRHHIALLLNLGSKADDIMIHSDQFRLNQVITSLLSNAFKYTEKGVIEFGYQMDEGEDKITFFVTDSGKGVLQEKSKQIFESFEKGDEYEYGKGVDSGVGLGLTLSKGIIELMGGEIWVEDNVFKGSTFKFFIPCKAVREIKSQL